MIRVPSVVQEAVRTLDGSLLLLERVERREGSDVFTAGGFYMLADELCWKWRM